MKAKTRLAVTAALVALAAPAAAGPDVHPKFGAWGVDLTAMDKSVKPGNDFYDFVNGTWEKSATIPPDRVMTGLSMDVDLRIEGRLKAIIASLEAKPTQSLNDQERKLRDLYDGYLDQKSIDAAGLAPAKKDLDFIAGLTSLDDVAAAMGRADINLAGPFGGGVGVDSKNSNQYQLEVAQAGLSMSRDYYLKDDAAMAAARDAYKKHVARIFALAGIGDGDRRAAAVYDLEHQMAEAHWTNVENLDPNKTYNPMSLSQLKALAPQFNWEAYFKAGGLPMTGPNGERQVNVHQPSAFPKIAAIFAATPVAVWRDYLTVHYLDSYAGYLPKAFDDESFAFFGTALRGNQQQLPRATRAQNLLDGRLGMALGKLYVEKYFPPEAEAKIVALVNNIIKVYDADIRTLTWMTPATRDKALEKLHRMSVKVGYPAHWRQYPGLVIERGDLLGDIERSNLYETRRAIARLDKPVDRTEWPYGPQTNNAGNDRNFNAIIFPAAFLQPPYFDPAADDAVNYGGIGIVIGHEISHSFDNQGSKFDALGNLNNWWTPADRAAFDAKAKALGAQYDTYEVLPGLHVNGALTMTENIADDSGAAIALKAYHLSLGGKPAPVLDGYSGDQRFFMAFAQSWRSKTRDGFLRQWVLSDEHTPDKPRVIGVTRNQDAWYDAFGVKPGDKYYLPPDQRVHIW